MGDDYTIADIASFPWVRNLVGQDRHFLPDVKEPFT